MADLKKIKVVFFGTPNFVLPVFSTLLNNFKLVGVVTTPDKPVGREQILSESPIKNAALLEKHTDRRDIVILTPETLDEDFINQLKELNGDLYVLASYGKILPQTVLDLPKFGMINIHPSLLPKYRGASPIQATILNGDTETAISIMLMDYQMDHGPILYQKQVDILPNETTESLLKRAFEKSSEVLPNIINDYISGKIKPTPQDDNRATYTWKTSETKQKAYFDIEDPPSPKVLDQMIRAFYPTPIVWTSWKGKIVKFYPNKVVQIEGKKPTALWDFLKGYPDFPIKELL